jgi:hypothetical protein
MTSWGNGEQAVAYTLPKIANGMPPNALTSKSYNPSEHFTVVGVIVTWLIGSTGWSCCKYKSCVRVIGQLTDKHLHPSKPSCLKFKGTLKIIPNYIQGLCLRCSIRVYIQTFQSIYNSSSSDAITIISIFVRHRRHLEEQVFILVPIHCHTSNN